MNHGFLYVIGWDGGEYFKIGITKRVVSERLYNLQVACPFRLKEFASYEIFRPELLEMSVHGHPALQKCRVEGEWFHCELKLILKVIDDTLKRFAQSEDYKDCTLVDHDEELRKAAARMTFSARS